MEETLRPAQRHRYVGKGGDSQERRRKEAGGRGDSTHGDRLIQGVENQTPLSCRAPGPGAASSSARPAYLGVTVSRQLFSMKAEG